MQYLNSITSPDSDAKEAKCVDTHTHTHTHTHTPYTLFTHTHLPPPTKSHLPHIPHTHTNPHIPHTTYTHNGRTKDRNLKDTLYTVGGK